MALLISLTPIVLLFLLMLVVKMPGYLSALFTLAAACLLAIVLAPAAGMESAGNGPTGGIVAMAVVAGMLKAVFPILLIILMAIFSYNILVRSGYIETIKSQFSSLTTDKGVLVLLMVWGFGGLLEGMAGFGTAVAIPAAMLIGLGFRPMFSALVALLGNTVATGFGSAGVPVITLCNEISAGGTATEGTLQAVSYALLFQLTLLFFAVPFVILTLTERQRLGRNLLLALWTGGITFGVEYVSVRWLGASTPAILGSIASIIALLIWAHCLAPADNSGSEKATAGSRKAMWREGLRAWSVYLLILLLILATGPMCPRLATWLQTHLISHITLPYIGGEFRIAWLGNASVWVMTGAVAGGFLQRLGLKDIVDTFGATLYGLRYSALTIVALIAMASVMNYSGMILTIADALVGATGGAYPLVAPLVGCLGTFMTGSDTSSNILFGRLQANVGGMMGLDNAGIDWLAAANTAGATGGKMISPQSIAIATAACDMKKSDDKILRKALPYALGYILIAGLTVYIGLRGV